MNLRASLQVVVGTIAFGLVAAGAVVPQATAAPSTYKRSVAISAPKAEVVEGDRFKVIAKIATPRQAKRVTLQRWNVPLYYGEPHWEPVKSIKVRKRKQIAFRRLATAAYEERFRAIVSYRTGKPVRSRPLTVKIWRWIPLSNYKPYYETSGLMFVETTVNGRRYKGYGAVSWSRAGAWEGRFTPGRNCRAFRAVLGVSDISADGSSGQIGVTADDVTVYESPSLMPGMDVPMEISFDLPYRIGLQLFDTSPEGVDSWPVLGEPALLCTTVGP